MLLALVDRRLQHFPLGAVPEAVINQLGIARHQTVLQMAGAAIKRNLLNTTVRFQQNSPARCLVNPAGFHTNKAVLNKVETPNPMLPAQLVELRQDCGRAHRFSIDAHSIAALKANFDVFCFVRSLLRADSALIHIVRCHFSRVFQNLAFG